MTARNHSTLFFVLAVLTVVMARSTSQAQSPKPINGNGEVEKSGEPYSGYRAWTPVNKEPKAIGAKAMRACAPAGRVGPPVDPHEGGFINVYVNQIGRDEYLDKKSPAFAAGSVIVKEKLQKKDRKGPIELGVMIKREAGFAPDSGDWQFLFVDQKGTVSDGQGLQKSCVACHRMHTTEDFVFRKLSPDVFSGRGNEESTSNGTRHNGNARGRATREE
jgi:hypothetical protein